MTISLLVLGVEFLLERDAELSSETLESLEILLILTFVLDLGADACIWVSGEQRRSAGYGYRRTFENSDGSGEVVDATSCAESSRENLNGRDEIVGKSVVQVALRSHELVNWFTVVHQISAPAGRALVISADVPGARKRLGRRRIPFHIWLTVRTQQKYSNWRKSSDVIVGSVTESTGMAWCRISTSETCTDTHHDSMGMRTWQRIPRRSPPHGRCEAWQRCWSYWQ